MKSTFTIVLMLFSLFAFSQSIDTVGRGAVIGVIDNFFLAMEKKDTILYGSTVRPDGQIWTVRRLNDTLKTSMRNFSADKVSLVKMNAVIEERPLSYEIMVHNDIAVAWVPYTLSLSGKFSHCGVDVFTLLKTIHGWQIVNLTYSIEPEACNSFKKR
jgi:hypothetical protein